MDSLELKARTVTAIELDCGCLFDMEGDYEVGQTLTCPDHRAWAQILASDVVVPDGVITG
ncbi:hypothetical protein [Amycolatopsis sp. cg9]|uniref:hypothetical protein n=1 Tax=Amycolatopsis sp. cg9 TaxID=3238801 RepID=UPI00352456EE